VLVRNKDFRGTVSRCYYAAYQAMWAAVGDPEKKPRWEHLGIIKTFVRGNWSDDRDRTGQPGLFERQRFSLRRLYDLRLGADYRLDPIGQKEARWAIQVAQDVIALGEQRENSHETTDEE
jgi:hypothetical protein